MLKTNPAVSSSSDLQVRPLRLWVAQERDWRRNGGEPEMGPSHPEQLISGLILKLSGSEGSRIFFSFFKDTRAWKFHHRKQLGRIKSMCYQQQRDVIIQRGWTGVDLLKWCRAAGHRGLPPLLSPKLCDMSNNQQIPPGSFWECWFVRGVSTVWVEGWCGHNNASNLYIQTHIPPAPLCLDVKMRSGSSFRQLNTVAAVWQTDSHHWSYVLFITNWA